MCESIEIRYAHYMEHANYPDVISVGCVCAEHLEQDYIRPQQREGRLKSAARRRKTWAARKWYVSARGNSYLNTDGFNITVFQRGAGFRLSVSSRETNNTYWGRKDFPSEEAAKTAAFDALMWAKGQL
jgi:hypothetical protein